ncbi:MAG: DUF2828 family protein [Saprospiraceae bacterium]|nr:DUF2828 family protein [Saprospiraceae bacterium]
MSNQFLKNIYHYDTTTENGALSHSTSGSALLDYFSKCGTYRDRSLEEVFATMGKLWNESPSFALKLVFYNRMITRQAKGFLESDQVQKGQGNRKEFRQSIIWLAKYQPESLYKNLWLIPVVGTWKDLWHEDLIDYLDQGQVFQLISKGMADDYNSALLAKYLPRMRSKSNTRNDRHIKLNRFALDLMKHLQWSPKRYRQFKSSGKAHTFQQLASQQRFEDIRFKEIPGKALFQWVNQRGKDGKTIVERQQLEARYLDWIKTQPTAKFTGYVYELMKVVRTDLSRAQAYTVNKQFEHLLALARQDGKIQENVWCALDTSGSMQCPVADTTAYDICISLGVYFSSLNEGAFQDHIIMFDQRSRAFKLRGEFVDKVRQITTSNIAWGNTNFQSVIDEIVRIRKKQPQIPREDFPTTLLVVSDMQFDPVGENTQTNYEEAMQKLAAVGLPNMRIVWWWVTGRGGDLPNTLDDEGVILIGGFDGAILSLLLGQEKTSDKGTNAQPIRLTPYEAMLTALEQEILDKISI